MIYFLYKGGHKGHQRSIQQWHYITKYLSIIMWKVLYFYEKVYDFSTIRRDTTSGV